MTRTLELLGFGEVLWDIFQIAPDTFRRAIGGAPANVAVQVARLGGRSAVLGAVGRDAFGDDLAARLREEGVDTFGVARRAERTGIAFVLRTHDGQPRFLFYRQATADMAYDERDLPKRLPRARFALVGTSTLVRPALADATHAFVHRAHDGGARIFVDLNVRAHLWNSRDAMREAIGNLVSHASVVKASSDDLAALGLGGGGAGIDSRAEKRAIEWLRARAPNATIFVTRGEGTSSALGAFGRVDVPAKRSRCVDAVGAGDGFIAGVVRVLSSLPERERSAPSAEAARAALRIGNAVGARVVRGLGALGADTRPLRVTCERALETLRSRRR